MPDLPSIARRRMHDLGVHTLADLYRLVPADGNRASYETVRKILRGIQVTTRDPRVTHTLSIMLDIDPRDVAVALGSPPTYGDWVLPPRAQRLDPRERQVVMAVIDALIRARRENHHGPAELDGQSR